MKIPEYMKEFEKIKHKFKGQNGIIEVRHLNKFEDELDGCVCPTNFKVIARDNKEGETSMFGYRHIFTDRTIEPLDDLGMTGVIAYMADGNKIYGTQTKKK